MARHPAAIEIRRIEPGEHALCARIHTDAWNAALPELPRSIGIAEFEAGIEGELTFVARVHGRTVGYVSVQEHEWFVHHLYVDPATRGAGVGTALISHVEDLAVPYPIGLKCLSANRGAMRFYEARGFERAPETGTDEDGPWTRWTKTRATNRSRRGG